MTIHKNIVKSLAMPLTMMIGLSACDMKRNLDDMHDSTIKMEETTAKVEKHSESIDDQTGELYDALRQGDALQSRRAALQNLIETGDPLHKLSEAAKYFMAFEYHLWSGSGPDQSAQKRLNLATLAAQEFFKDIEQFIPGGEMVAKPFAGQILRTDKSNLINSFNALSATLDYLNPKQIANLEKDKSLKAITMYSMIEESLLAKASIESGKTHIEDYPGYVREILFSDKEAVYLVQARYNYLAALIMGKVTDAQYSKITGARMAFTDWNLDLANLNTVQITELNGFLVKSQKAKDLLLAVGVKPQTDALLLRMYGHMKLKRSLIATSNERTKAEQEFINNTAGFTAAGTALP